MNPNFFSIAFFIGSLAIMSSSCIQEKTSKQDKGPTHLPDSVWLSRGQEISMALGSTLLAEVSKNLQESGVPGTVKYCNLHAYRLTDSIATLYGAFIKRTSSQIRNPRNAPDSLEQAMLTQYAESHENGDPLAPQLFKGAEKHVRYFAPIYLAAPCVQCHGEVGKGITEENYATIRSLYPEDEAKGFEPGDLRGMWSITFGAR